MRGKDTQQSAMFSYVSPERRVPADHPLRPIRAMVDVAFKVLSRSFGQMYPDWGRPSIAPEKLLRALLLQLLYSIRSVRSLHAAGFRAHGRAGRIDTRRVERGIGDAESEIFEQARLLQIDAVLDVVMPDGGGYVGLHAPVQKLALLVLGGRLIGQRVATAVVVELILADVRIDGQQGVRIDGVLVAGRDVPGKHALALVLRELVQIVGNLNPVSRREQVQVNDVPAGGLIIEAVENGLILSDIVVWNELRRIEKTSAANAVDGQKIADLRVAETEPEASAHSAEGAVAGIDIAEHLAGAEAGARGDLRHQAGFIAKLGAGRSGDQLHALNGAGGQRGGENLALLIADELPVDQVTDLRVVARGMEASVGVVRNGAGRIDDRVGQSAAGTGRGQALEGAAVYVDVGAGIGFDYRGAAGLHVDGGFRRGHRQNRLARHRHGRANHDLLRKRCRAGGSYFQVIGVRRNIGQAEGAVVTRSEGLLITGDGVGEGNGRHGNHRARLIDNTSLNRSGIAQRLREYRTGEQKRDSQSKSFIHRF